MAQNQAQMGRNWIKRVSDVGHMGHPGHVKGPVGHVGSVGHVGHWASGFMQNGYWHYWILSYGYYGLPACIMGH